MLAEPMYDVNGNAIDASMLGAAAGAGDGRGIHSDQSQDSSGRGTSLSSSNTSSSSPQSEASILFNIIMLLFYYHNIGLLLKCVLGYIGGPVRIYRSV